jgi:DNA-binding CsgD family transcriptional regulator
MARFTKRRLQAAYRLVVEVCLLGHDGHAWTQRLMEGLVKLFEARCAALAWAGLPERPGAFNKSEIGLVYGFTPEEEDIWRHYCGPDRTFRSEFLRRVVNIPARFVTVRRQDVMNDKEWYALPEVREIHQACGIDANMASFFVVPSMRRLFGIGVHRAWGEPQFTEDDRRQLRLLHVELARAWRHRLAAPAEEDPAIANLPDRLAQVLWLLCLGRSEKEVAAELRLSTKTVHNHVSRLHRRLEVANRGELLARAIARGSLGTLPAMPGRHLNQFLPPM